MEETLITFETAKLAKQSGFNWEVKYGVFGQKMKLTKYFGNDRYPELILRDWNKKPRKSFSVPSQSLLQKWLRDKHNILIEINLANITKDFVLTVLNKKGTLFHQTYHHVDYEMALEKGLQESLSLLIKENGKDKDNV